MRRNIAYALLVGLLTGAVWTVVASAGVSEAEEGMVGSAACGRCHPGALVAWQKSAHQRAAQALSGKQSRDPRCLQCHGQSGVQCEDCHGLGQHYATRYVMKDKVLSRLVGLVDVDQAVCLRCHTDAAPSLRPFAYADMLDIIAHGLDTKQEKSK